MFRQPVRRSFSTFVRRSLYPLRRAEQTPDGANSSLQKVRFRRGPFFTSRRAISLIVYMIPIYVFFKYIPIIIEISIEDDEAEKVGPDGKVSVERDNEEEDEEEFEGDEDAWFFPMTWPKQQPRTFYKGADPEWQEFIKFARDPKRHKEVHQQLVRRIRSEVAQYKHAKRILGRMDQDKGRFWLDTTFPDGPPRVYETRGIEIGDGYIAWAAKDLEQEEFHKLRQSLIPTAALWSSVASARYLFEKQRNKVKDYLGMPQTWTPEVERSMMMAGVVPSGKPLRTQSKGAKTLGKSSTSSEQQDQSEPRQSATQASAAAADGSSAVAKGSTTDSKNIGLPKSGLFSPEREKPVTLLIFLTTMRSQTKQRETEPPRGCVRMSGLVEMVGKNGRLIMDVVAAYNPGTDEFPATLWRARTYQPRAQRPRGDTA